MLESVPRKLLPPLVSCGNTDTDRQTGRQTEAAHGTSIQYLVTLPSHIHDFLLCVCVCFFLPVYSGRQVRRMYQPGSHRRKDEVFKEGGGGGGIGTGCILPGFNIAYRAIESRVYLSLTYDCGGYGNLFIWLAEQGGKEKRKKGGKKEKRG